MIEYVKNLILLLLLAICTAAFPQVEFIEVVTEQDMLAANQKGMEEGKMLFVDVYATWCGPCKMMDRDVYSDAGVGRYMNTHFVNVRMDGETPFGRKYSASHQLQGFPSMFVFSSTGEQVGQLVGYKPAEELLSSLGGMVENFAVIRRYRIEHEQGILSMASYPAYVQALRGMDMEQKAEEVAAEYIGKRKGVELSDDDIRVVAYYTRLDDPWWPEFIADRERLHRVLAEDFKPVIDRIYSNSLIDAVEQEDIGSISRIANELTPLMDPEEGRRIDQRSLPFLQYYYYTDQLSELTGYVDRRYDSDRKDDHGWLCGAAVAILSMDQQKRTPVLLEKEEKWLSECLGFEETYDYCFYMGMVLLFQQRSPEAKSMFEKAGPLASSEEEKAMLDQVLRYIGSR